MTRKNKYVVTKLFNQFMNRKNKYVVTKLFNQYMTRENKYVVTKLFICKTVMLIYNRGGRVGKTNASFFVHWVHVG
jgi:hypothetical protein